MFSHSIGGRYFVLLPTSSTEAAAAAAATAAATFCRRCRRCSSHITRWAYVCVCVCVYRTKYYTQHSSETHDRQNRLACVLVLDSIDFIWLSQFLMGYKWARSMFVLSQFIHTTNIHMYRYLYRFFFWFCWFWNYNLKKTKWTEQKNSLLVVFIFLVAYAHIHTQP